MIVMVMVVMAAEAVSNADCICVRQAALAIFLEMRGLYGDGDLSPSKGYIWIVMVDNVSITLAMYFLVLFYAATAPELQRFRPVPKFVCIKTVIFLSFWQGVAIAVLEYFGILRGDITRGWSSAELSVGLQEFLICIEMLFVSIAHSWTFGYHSFRTENSCADWVPCFHLLCCCCCCCTVTKNFRHVVSQRDVIADGVDTFEIKAIPGAIANLSRASFSRVVGAVSSTANTRHEHHHDAAMLDGDDEEVIDREIRLEPPAQQPPNARSMNAYM